MDIEKAHLTVKFKGDEVAFIDFPDAWGEPGECGQLKRWLYGMRLATSAWEGDYSRTLGEFGMTGGGGACSDDVRRGRAGHQGRRSRRRLRVPWVAQGLGLCGGSLKRHDELKVWGVLGGDAPGGSEIVTLSRKLTCKGNDMKYEVGEEHAGRICDDGLGPSVGP